jgi:prepilin-type N-terminal cleavage/methylation domain-containing protein
MKDHGQPPSRMPRNRPTPGFTLIELLAVIAIIGVLGAIVLLSMGKVRETTRRAGCASNLRQIGVLIQLHAHDNKGRLPGPLWTTFGPYPSDSDTGLLVYQLQRYLTDKIQLNGTRPHIKIFECPSWADAIPAAQQLNGRCYVLGRAAKVAGGGTVLPFGYPELGNNAAASPLMVNQMENPAKTLAITDLDAVNGGASYANVAGVATTPVHGGVRNELYFDGRVAAVAVP